MLTHNHEKYVAEAIQSALSQKVNFEYTILVGDDGSTDGTVEIVTAFSKKYPDRIKLYTFLENHGIYENVINLYSRYNGKYLANLDGDDYWTDEHKLQIQVDLLENHPEYAACFHDVTINSTEIIGDESNSTIEKSQKHHYHRYSQIHQYSPEILPFQIVDRLIIPTSSLVYRNGQNLTDAYRSSFRPDYSFDWWLNLAIVKNSKITYIPREMGVYREHGESHTKKVPFPEKKAANIRILKYLLKDDYYRHFKKWIFKGLAREYNSLANDSSSDVINQRMANQKYFWYGQRAVLSGFLDNLKFIRNPHTGM